MAFPKKITISVQGRTISTMRARGEDYISLTDMVRGAESGRSVLGHWISNKNTIEFLGIWEQLHNTSFKLTEFRELFGRAGTNRFTLSPQRWIAETRAVGLLSKSGRYGGTYAQKDIAFEFGAWLSPEFKLLLIQEFQRLKEWEQEKRVWDVPRYLAKINYRIQTDAIQEVLLPRVHMRRGTTWLLYSDEADLINVIIFGQTAKEWRAAHRVAANRGENVRDEATILELTLVSNLEMLNAHLIREGIEKGERFRRLMASAKTQTKSLSRARSTIEILHHERRGTFGP